MKNIIFGFSLLVILISSCSPLKVASDYETTVNFKEYQSFKLLLDKSSFPKAANPLNQKRLEKGIQENMIALNFKASENPDLFVIYFVQKKTEQRVKFYEDYYEDWDYKNQYELFQYKVGTLVVDLIDAKNKKVIWHGVISRPTPENMKTAEKRINANVKAMFEKLAKDIKNSK